jgi:CcmD family protein
MKNDLLSLLLQADPAQKWLFQSEKIYTVLAVVLIIWLGIIVYLLFLRRDVTRLEKEVKQLTQQKGRDGVSSSHTAESKLSK